MTMNRSVTATIPSMRFFASMAILATLASFQVSAAWTTSRSSNDNMIPGMRLSRSLLTSHAAMMIYGRSSTSTGSSLLTVLCSSAVPSANDAAAATAFSTTTASAAQAVPTDTTPVSIQDEDPSVIKELCQARNFPLEKVKNARDLASATSGSNDESMTTSKPTIRPGRLIRMGRPSDATDADVEMLLQQLQFKTLIDLRSPTELKDDVVGVLRSDMFGSFTNMVWKEAGSAVVSSSASRRLNDGCVRELQPGEFPVKQSSMFWNRSNSTSSNSVSSKGEDGNSDKDIKTNDKDATAMTPDTIGSLATVAADDLTNPASLAEDMLCDLDCADSSAVPAYQVEYQNRRERHFVSLMNELKYVRGTLGKVRKRDTFAAVMKSPGALLSSRIRTSVKEPFLQQINQGGLLMLNELLLRYGAPGIKYVLQLCSDRQRHPVGFYCTAGKDRTGMIAAIILSLCGVAREDIVRDYSLSANVYAEMNDHQAMVGALSQRSLDPKTFLGAPAHVMRETLEAIDAEYGSVEEYCNWIGFGREDQEKLRRACLDE